MTRWERFYRWMGGAGPEAPPSKELVIVRWWHWLQPYAWPCTLAVCLKNLGFLKRDPALAGRESSYFVNFRWQWRFWRGPYRDCLERDGLWHRRVVRRHRPFKWVWGQNDEDRRYGVRHYGFWFTEPTQRGQSPPVTYNMRRLAAGLGAVLGGHAERSKRK